MAAVSPGERQRFGPIALSAGVLPRHVLTLFYASTLLMVFINVTVLLQPFLLHEHLRMPTERQGDFTGNLAVVAEIIVFLLVVPLGSLSDRIGRRPVFVAGFLAYAAGLGLLPLASNPTEYFFCRGVIAVGAACGVTMVAAVLADYPQNASRGKLISVNGICTGLGLVLIASFGFAQLPELLVGRGLEPRRAGLLTFLLAAGLAVVTAAVAGRGLKPGRGEASPAGHVGLREQARVGFRELRHSPRLRLAAAATFVSRGDLMVLAGFFSLWLVAVGTDEGLTAADAQGAAGRLFGVSQLAMLAFTPLMGWLADRVDRVSALCLAMAGAALGYAALGLVTDPLHSPLIYAVALLAGAGEAGVIVTAPALVGQEAPGHVRGAVIGFMALVGAVGVLVNVKVSGVLFDTVDYQAPFLMMAGLNAVVLVWALAVRWRHGPSALAG